MRVRIVTAAVLIFASTLGYADEQADEILRRAVAAAGGTEAIDRMRKPMMWTERWIFHGIGERRTRVVKYAAKWPNLFRQEVEGLYTFTARDGKAWLTSAGGGKTFTGQPLVEKLQNIRAAWARRLFPLSDARYQLTVVPGHDVEGRATFGLRASHPEHRDLTLLFDRDSLLMAKAVTTVVTPESAPTPIPRETVYTDYKLFDGVRLPGKFKLYYDGKLMLEAETLDYTLDATLDLELFKEPEES